MSDQNPPQPGQNIRDFPGYHGTMDGDVIDERTGKPVPVPGGTLKAHPNGDTYS